MKFLGKAVWMATSMLAWQTATAKRPVTIDDLIALRQVDALSISPDGRRYAILVREGRPDINDYSTEWLVGAVQGGALTSLGDGGEVWLKASASGYMGGEIAVNESRWSPDGHWLAYTLRSHGEVQLWRSRADGRERGQLTHNAADVHEFEWSANGRSLYFMVGAMRDALQASEEARGREGYNYDEDLYFFTDFMRPPLKVPLPQTLEAWVLDLTTGLEHAATPSERVAFADIQRRRDGGIEPRDGQLNDIAVPPVARPDGALVWLSRLGKASQSLQVRVSISTNPRVPIACSAPECSGLIKKVWWSEDGRHVFFWRGEGINYTTEGVYAWSPPDKSVRTILRTLDDDLQFCSAAASDRLICVRQTPTQPPHIAAIDPGSGAVRTLADVNPEFADIRLGRVERFEWETPKFSWSEPGGALAGLYPERTFGYILYPPDFVPGKSYPVFIDPYVAHGFASSAGMEHPLPVYAAKGIVVLNMEFPMPIDISARLGATAMQQLYSARLDFPHLTMLMESTVRGLDVAAARGFVDERRVGIGGVSHGTFVPLYLMQKHDRIAAISISSPGWGPHEYYWGTRKGRESVATAYGDVGNVDWRVKPEGAGREFWRRIDIADHVEEIEAPILMQLAAQETYPLVRLIRHLADADKPYDAYVFPEETHLKWQPAHLEAIMNRNLDWFRFWFQSHEDTAPDKAQQYIRWRQLLALQCRNPRALAAFCDAPDGLARISNH